MRALDKFVLKILKKGSRLFLDKGITNYFPSVSFFHENKVTHNQFLIDVALAAVDEARRNSLADLAAEKSHLKDSIYYDLFPGEHYRLLRSLVGVLGSKNIIEIGTLTGMGTVSLAKGMGERGRVTTFDLVAWDQFDTHLSKDLFEQKKVAQILADLSDPETFAKHRELIGKADLIFCDGPKDGVFEINSWTCSRPSSSSSKCLLVLDDIRFLNMISLWWSIELPKLDLTSFGHWSGNWICGYVQWSQAQK